MIKISEHAMERYVQRVLGIKEKTKTFLQDNQFEVAYRIQELLHSAEVLFKNFAPSKKETLDYYINEELLLVINTNKNELTTLFYVTLEADDSTNTKMVKEYVKQIKKNNSLSKHLEIKIRKQGKESDHLEYMIERLEGRIDLKEFVEDFAYSINTCKNYALDSKKLKDENRNMMKQIFKKLQ